MCTGAELVALAGATATTVSAGAAIANKPADPAKLSAEADAKAAADANGRLALRNKALAANSLLTGAPTGGKTTFGG